VYSILAIKAWGKSSVIPISHPHIGQEERDAVLSVLDSGMLVQGERVAALEHAFIEQTHARHAVAVNSGTAALHVALLAHGIGPGDEVITTPFTFIASVNAILFCGAVPKFVDILPCCMNIDPAKIEAAITSRTKAILPVHLFGFPVAMNSIDAIAHRHGLIVIQDAAQAIGASVGRKRLGEFGTACYSLYATKNVQCVEGGMITTNDDLVAERCRLLRSHGAQRRYYHDILGYNYRLSDLHASIAIPQIQRLDEIVAKRRANAAFLSANIKRADVRLPVAGNQGCERAGACANVGHVWHQYTIRLPASERASAIVKLAAAGVGTSIFYPIPAHKQKHLIDLGFGDALLPIAERAVEEVLSIPVHDHLSQESLAKVAQAVNEL
jgi:perosamine synthetase